MYICATTFKYTGWRFVFLFVKSGSPTAKGCWLNLGPCWWLPGLDKPAREARNRMASGGAGLWDFKATWSLILLAYGEGHKGHVVGGDPDILILSVVGQEGALALGRAPQGHAQSQVEGSCPKGWGARSAASEIFGAIPVLAVDTTCDLGHITYPICASMHPAVKWG